MKKFHLLSLLLISILFFKGNIGCQEEVAPPTSNASEYVSGEAIVKFKPEAFSEAGELISESIKALNNEYGPISMEPLFKGKPAGGLAYIYKLKFPEEVDIGKIVQRYSKDPFVIYAEPNYIMHAVKKESDAD